MADMYHAPGPWTGSYNRAIGGDDRELTYRWETVGKEWEGDNREVLVANLRAAHQIRDEGIPSLLQLTAVQGLANFLNGPVNQLLAMPDTYIILYSQG